MGMDFLISSSICTIRIRLSGGENFTRISMSLVFFPSPRAQEPEMVIRSAPYLLQDSNNRFPYFLF